MMIKMRKGYQYAITPTQQQAQKIEQNIGCARFIYNKLLEDKIKYYETNKKSIRLTPAPYKAEYPFLKDADSMALTNAQINLETAFKKFLMNLISDFLSSNVSISAEQAIRPIA